jgi:hypothetical protein
LIFLLASAGYIAGLSYADCCHNSIWPNYGLCTVAVQTRCDSNSGTNDYCYPKCNSAPSGIGSAWCNIGPLPCATLSSYGLKRNESISERDEEQQKEPSGPRTAQDPYWDIQFSSFAKATDYTRELGALATAGHTQSGTTACNQAYSTTILDPSVFLYHYYWIIDGTHGPTPAGLAQYLTDCSTEAPNPYLFILRTPLVITATQQWSGIIGLEGGKLKYCYVNGVYKLAPSIFCENGCYDVYGRAVKPYTYNSGIIETYFKYGGGVSLSGFKHICYPQNVKG